MPSRGTPRVGLCESGSLCPFATSYREKTYHELEVLLECNLNSFRMLAYISTVQHGTTTRSMEIY